MKKNQFRLLVFLASWLALSLAGTIAVALSIGFAPSATPPLLTAVVLSSALDITGILAAGSMAVLGLFVIPYKRKQAKENFKEKMGALRIKLIETLTIQFNNECAGAVERLKDGIAPYTRYIRAERDAIQKAETSLAEVRQKLSALHAHCETVVK